jgi:hypothetical protein
MCRDFLSQSAGHCQEPGKATGNIERTLHSIVPRLDGISKPTDNIIRELMLTGPPMAQKMTLVSILEQKMDELARKYVETHNQKIIDELCELARELMEMEKLEKQ